jgi:CRISPR/Cas system-associated endonuclease Cas3-HD
MIWSCPYINICNFNETKFCGNGKEGPIYLAFHGASVECYVGHVINCWNEWLEIRDRWLPSIKRVCESITGNNLDMNILEKVLGAMILHHDIGKLTKEYQEKRFYRHESISTHVLFPWLREITSETTSASMFSSAVYLHHEGLQIAHKHFEMREPTYSYLLNWLSPWTFSKVVHWDEIISQINHFYDIPIISAVQNDKIFGSNIAKTLGDILIEIDGCPEPLVARMGVAAILHPLTICDNRAAAKRGGKTTEIGRAIGPSNNLSVGKK